MHEETRSEKILWLGISAIIAPLLLTGMAIAKTFSGLKWGLGWACYGTFMTLTLLSLPIIGVLWHVAEKAHGYHVRVMAQSKASRRGP